MDQQKYWELRRVGFFNQTTSEESKERALHEVVAREMEFGRKGKIDTVSAGNIEQW